jgi:hypothetical protein
VLFTSFSTFTQSLLLHQHTTYWNKPVSTAEVEARPMKMKAMYYDELNYGATDDFDGNAGIDGGFSSEEDYGYDFGHHATEGEPNELDHSDLEGSDGSSEGVQRDTVDSSLERPVSPQVFGRKFGESHDHSCDVGSLESRSAQPDKPQASVTTRQMTTQTITSKIPGPTSHDHSESRSQSKQLGQGRGCLSSVASDAQFIMQRNDEGDKPV